MVDACPALSSTRPHALPRSGTLHSSHHHKGFLIGRRFAARQRSVSQQLLSQTQSGSCSGVVAQLVGDPRRERNTETINDGHNIVWDADCLVRHVRILHTVIEEVSRLPGGRLAAAIRPSDALG